ncbi:Hypothetical predicted protein [Xyrichtys novacula]|uniref:Uncharacterized protein n=1 Tax=Xyrichtys novacula TaxID=13765 RepID=A0AAV1GJN8_XYRNO|nr:Hypothetical predicted protein [Xyrichtys novacula]
MRGFLPSVWTINSNPFMSSFYPFSLSASERHTAGCRQRRERPNQNHTIQTIKPSKAEAADRPRGAEGERGTITALPEALFGPTRTGGRG